MCSCTCRYYINLGYRFITVYTKVYNIYIYIINIIIYILYISRKISNRPESMSHDHVSVKAEGSVDTDLGVVTTEEGGQPATLSSVHQQEHHVMVLDQLLQSLHLLGHLSCLSPSL